MKASYVVLIVVVAGFTAIRVLVTLGSSPDVSGSPPESSSAMSAPLQSGDEPLEEEAENGMLVFKDTWSEEDEGQDDLESLQTFNASGEAIPPVDSYFDSGIGSPLRYGYGYGYGSGFGYGRGYGYRSGYGFMPLGLVGSWGSRPRGLYERSGRSDGFFTNSQSTARSRATAAAPSAARRPDYSDSGRSAASGGSFSTNTSARRSDPAGSSSGGVASEPGSPTYRSGPTASRDSGSTNTSSNHPSSPSTTSSSSGGASHSSSSSSTSSSGSHPSSSSSSSSSSRSSSSSSSRHR